MSLDDDIRIIASAQLFDALQAEQLRLLAFGVERLRFNQSRVIYREGDRADCGFVVASGQVQISKTIDGTEKSLKIAQEGMVLGEMAMITETTRLTNAIALTDCELVRINRSLFRRILSEYPDIAAAIHSDLSIRLKDFLREIAKLDRSFDNRSDL
ncbi:MAG: cyclic nucleotide-binding domain-containing protein [Ahrensia sp.]|nr:cyclic nucleotide-binding domain-containing protein [Ahrensia sp.]